MRKKHNIILLLFGIFTGFFSSVFGQKTLEEDFDALETKIYEAGIDQSKAFDLSKLYLAKAKKTNEILKISDGYSLCVTYSLNEVDKAKYADSLINYNVKTKDDRLIGYAYRGASVSYLNLNDYNKALDYALISYEYSINEESKQYTKNSESLIARIKFLLEDYEDAKKMFQEIVDYYEWKHIESPSNSNRSLYIGNSLRLIKTNAALKDFEANIPLFAKLDKVFKEHQDIQEYQPDYQSALGFQSFMQGKYNPAIAQFNKALALYTNQEKHLYEKFYIGMSYWKLQDTEKAKTYFNEILKDYEQTGRISMEYRPMFEFYIDYYKAKGNREEQLIAVDQLLAYDRNFELEQKDIAKKINVDYDNKRLLEEKAQLESDQKTERWGFATMIGLLVLSLVLWLRYKKQKKKASQMANLQEAKPLEPFTKEEILEIKEISEVVVSQENELEEVAREEEETQEIPEPEILQPVEIEENAVNEIDEKETSELIEEEKRENDEEEIAFYSQIVPKKENEYSEYLPINKDTAIQILKKIEQFEKRKRFLKKNIRLVNLATEMNTNDKYLSRVIKVKTGKIFHQYITDLRFDYLDNLLQNDPEIRKKQIKDISKKLGYSTPEFFTVHFRERYGVAPTEFFKADEGLSEEQAIPNN